MPDECCCLMRERSECCNGETADGHGEQHGAVSRVLVAIAYSILHVQPFTLAILCFTGYSDSTAAE